MTPEQKQQLQAHVTEIAKLLYVEATAQGMELGTLVEIKKTVRSQLLTHVSPEIGNFLSTPAPTQTTDTPAISTASSDVSG